MKRDEFMQLLKGETMEELSRRKEQIDNSGDDYNTLVSGIALMARVTTVATVNALEKAGFIKFED